MNGKLFIHGEYMIFMRDCFGIVQINRMRVHMFVGCMESILLNTYSQAIKKKLK